MTLEPNVTVRPSPCDETVTSVELAYNNLSPEDENLPDVIRRVSDLVNERNVLQGEILAGFFVRTFESNLTVGLDFRPNDPSVNSSESYEMMQMLLDAIAQQFE